MKRFIVLCLLALVVVVAPVKAQTAPATASIVLTWGASTTPGMNYNVYRESQPGACIANATGVCTLVNATQITALTFTDTPAAGSNYWYIVRAVVPGGAAHAPGVTESNNSNEVAAFLAVPNPPTNLTCTFTVTNGTVSGSCH